MGKKEEHRAAIKFLTGLATDKGRVIEMGWNALRLYAIPPGASEGQVRDMRMAFFAGAHHLWASVFMFLDEGAEATDQDVDRFSLVSAELDAFTAELERWVKEHTDA